MKIKCLGMSEREQRDVIKIILAESFDGETAKPQTVTDKMTTPQPIATAPSGQRILVYCQRNNEGWWQIAMLSVDFERWIKDDFEQNWMITQPTLWLPLPPTPTQPQ